MLRGFFYVSHNGFCPRHLSRYALLGEMNVHEIIDRFVSSVVSPEANFRRVENALWIDDLEAKLPKRFPASFRSLITRYSFAAFDCGELSFFANLGDGSDEDLSVAVFRDRFLSDATLQAGFIQFARPVGGSYDPICFDANRSRSNQEFPIVRLDHEAILCRDKIRVIEEVADSFLKFALEKTKRA